MKVLAQLFIFLLGVGFVLVFHPTDRTQAAPNVTCSVTDNQLLLVPSLSASTQRINSLSGAVIDSTFYAIGGAGVGSHEAIIAGDNLLIQAYNTVLERIDLSTGGSAGADITLSSSAHGLTLGSDGLVYATLQGGSVVSVDPVSGTVTTVLPGGTLDDPFTDGSFGIEFGPDGDLYAVSKRDDAGTIRSSIKRYDGTTFAAKADFIAETAMDVADIEFHTDGNLYLAAVTGILRYNATTGAFVDSYSATNTTHLEFMPNGDLLAAEQFTANILRYTAPSTSSVVWSSGGFKSFLTLPAACYDWGDAADSSVSVPYAHPVQNTDNGARHLINKLHFGGAAIDDESDAQPNADATGDDATDDEDALSGLPASVETGNLVSVTYTADGRGVGSPVNCAGFLNMWVDLNGDGDWLDGGEHVADGQALGYSCSTTVNFTPTAASGDIMIRTRYSTIQTLATTGAAPDGEVEDYALTVTAASDPNTAALGDYVWYDTNFNGVQDAGEDPVTGVTVELFSDVDADGIAEPDADDGSAIATQSTDSSGFYQFTSLAAGSYFVRFSNLPEGYYLTNSDSGSDSTDSDADRTTGLTVVYVLGVGEVISTVDGGIQNTETLAATGVGALTLPSLGVLLIVGVPLLARSARSHANSTRRLAIAKYISRNIKPSQT